MARVVLARGARLALRGLDWVLIDAVHADRPGATDGSDDSEGGHGMKITSIDESARTACVVLTDGEARLLKQALNEVCNAAGFGDSEFGTRLGARREVARALMGDLGGVIKALRES